MLSIKQSTRQKAPDIESPHWINVKDNAFGVLTGNVVVVNFWTYNCHHCQSLLRHLSVLQRKYSNNKFKLIGVHTPEFLFESDLNNVKRAVRDFRIHWPVAVDNDYENFNKFESRFWPTTVVIDQEGNIAGRFIGAGSFPELARLVGSLLGS